MITNERQYKITKAQAEKFNKALAQRAIPSPRAPTIHPILNKALENALRSQLEELRCQIQEYEALRSGQRQTFAEE